MYSGITQGLYEVINLAKKPGLIDYTVNLSSELTKLLKPGDSVAIDGVCQSLVQLVGTHASFQAIQETLDKTTLNTLHVGRYVSVERSLRWGDEVGGHEVSGHVVGTAILYQKIQEHNNTTLVLKCDPDWMKYILPKGFIAVDGSSLTVGQTYIDEGLFCLHLIPETLRLTNFSKKQIQDRVNIEFDYKTKTIVDTVERLVIKNGIAK
jgi:riboflavin synthase